MQAFKTWFLRPLLLGIAFFIGDAAVRMFLRLAAHENQINLIKDDEAESQKKLDELLKAVEIQQRELEAITGEVHRHHPPEKK